MEKQQILRQDKEIANPKLNRQSVKTVKEVQKNTGRRELKVVQESVISRLGPNAKHFSQVDHIKHYNSKNVYRNDESKHGIKVHSLAMVWQSKSAH